MKSAIFIKRVCGYRNGFLMNDFCSTMTLKGFLTGNIREFRDTVGLNDNSKNAKRVYCILVDYQQDSSLKTFVECSLGLIYVSSLILFDFYTFALT